MDILKSRGVQRSVGRGNKKGGVKSFQELKSQVGHWDLLVV